MAIGYAVKHNRLPLEELLFSRCDSVLSEECVEVGAVDVDFATDLGEGDETLVAVVLPCLWRYTEQLAGFVGFYPFAVGIIGVASCDQVDDLLQCVMEVAPFFFRHQQHCRSCSTTIKRSFLIQILNENLVCNQLMLLADAEAWIYSYMYSCILTFVRFDICR